MARNPNKKILHWSSGSLHNEADSSAGERHDRPNEAESEDGDAEYEEIVYEGDKTQEFEQVLRQTSEASTDIAATSKEQQRHKPRKSKNFIFTESEETLLFEAVLTLFPYGAPHGQTEKRWLEVERMFTQTLPADRRAQVPDYKGLKSRVEATMKRWSSDAAAGNITSYYDPKSLRGKLIDAVIVKKEHFAVRGPRQKHSQGSGSKKDKKKQSPEADEGADSKKGDLDVDDSVEIVDSTSATEKRPAHETITAPTDAPQSSSSFSMAGSTQDPQTPSGKKRGYSVGRTTLVEDEGSAMELRRENNETAIRAQTAAASAAPVAAATHVPAVFSSDHSQVPSAKRQKLRQSIKSGESSATKPSKKGKMMVSPSFTANGSGHLIDETVRTFLYSDEEDTSDNKLVELLDKQRKLASKRAELERSKVEIERQLNRIKTQEEQLRFRQLSLYQLRSSKLLLEKVERLAASLPNAPRGAQAQIGTNGAPAQAGTQGASASNASGVSGT